MEHQDYDTSRLWKSLLLLFGLAVLLSVSAFLLLILGEAMASSPRQPHYSKEQLADFTAKREKARRQEKSENWDLVENGIHVKTGFKDDPNLPLMIRSCTSCHSAKLITQNRATREGWKGMIVWMQETQGLPDFGENEPKILDYLEKHYAPEAVGRRANLDMAAIEWYILELQESSTD